MRDELIVRVVVGRRRPQVERLPLRRAAAADLINLWRWRGGGESVCERGSGGGGGVALSERLADGVAWTPRGKAPCAHGSAREPSKLRRLRGELNNQERPQ